MAKKNLAPWVCLSIVAGCGGGSDGGTTPHTPAPAAQSPGGIWHSLGGPMDGVTLLIAETGELKIIDAGPAFGAGAVIVNDGDQLVGSYDTRSIPNSTNLLGIEKSCDIEGTVVERVTIQATLHCSDADGGETTRTVGMAYDPVYASGSSLAEIAGNYTLSFKPETNILNINSDGVVFGMIDNGARCTLNGQVKIIDPGFNLYRFELLFSSCEIRPEFEAQTMMGLAFRDAPGLPAGAFLVVMTGSIDTRLEFFSVLYEPA